MLMTYFMLFAGKRNIYRFFFKLSLLLLASELGGYSSISVIFSFDRRGFILLSIFLVLYAGNFMDFWNKGSCLEE